eukprot:1138478-Pelagomonas_calceolata.AAC.7
MGKHFAFLEGGAVGFGWACSGALIQGTFQDCAVATAGAGSKHAPGGAKNLEAKLVTACPGSEHDPSVPRKLDLPPFALLHLVRKLRTRIGAHTFFPLTAAQSRVHTQAHACPCTTAGDLMNLPDSYQHYRLQLGTSSSILRSNTAAGPACLGSLLLSRSQLYNAVGTLAMADALGGAEVADVFNKPQAMCIQKRLPNGAARVTVST